MGKRLVIVESPTKARTIRRFLPADFHVEASIGHVRDLPQSASDVPKKFKGESWARLGIDVENDFQPLYVTPRGKGKVVQELKRQLKEADELYLATDEDREGESISWHLVEVLAPSVPVKRMVFHEITASAIEHALEHPRGLDMNLVRAQEARRILDRLYGFTLSPLIWKKIAYGLSAGRVQSPGLRMLVHRELERLRFQKAYYWDLKAFLGRRGRHDEQGFEATLTAYQGTKLAEGKDFDPETGDVTAGRSVLALDQERAEALKRDIEEKPWTVRDVSEKKTKTRPAAPFITSTLQQEGNRKLRLSARDTMRIAQRLYEEGFITYMRTDSPALSQEAIAGARDQVKELYGEDYLSEQPRQYGSKSRTAQEAHEAIRPVGTRFKHPSETGLEGRDRSLYELIWKRTLASQMAEAQKSSVSVKIQAGDAEFSAAGVRILFPGFLRVYVEGKDDPEAALDDKEVYLPPLSTGDELDVRSLDAVQHETKPPARYTEAGLVQRLEKEGIGRPSTYASIIATLFERDYVRRQNSALVPTFTGMAVTQLLEQHFAYLIDYSFTSEMEQALDEIAVGDRESLEYLRAFYLGEDGLKEQVKRREEEIDADESRRVDLPHVEGNTEVRVGRYGPYLVHRDADGEDIHASIPEETAPAELDGETISELVEAQKRGPEPLGTDPETGENVYVLVGRYGPYVQLGERGEEKPKPKRASLPKGMSHKELTLDSALKLLSLPRRLGVHPETGNEVLAGNGRFGPYVYHDGEYRSLKKDDDLFSIELDRALELLAEKKKGGRGSKLLKELGKHPRTDKSVALYEGRYGPYLKVGTKNVGLPKEKRDKETVEHMTLEDALELLENVDGSSGNRTKRRNSQSRGGGGTSKSSTSKSSTSKG